MVWALPHCCAMLGLHWSRIHLLLSMHHSFIDPSTCAERICNLCIKRGNRWFQVTWRSPRQWRMLRSTCSEPSQICRSSTLAILCMLPAKRQMAHRRSLTSAREWWILHSIRIHVPPTTATPPQPYIRYCHGHIAGGVTTWTREKNCDKSTTRKQKMLRFCADLLYADFSN